MGIIATIMFLLPGLYVYAYLFKVTWLARVLGWLPASLMADASTVSDAAGSAGFTPAVACLLLLMWCAAFVAAAAWRFARYE